MIDTTADLPCVDRTMLELPKYRRFSFPRRRFFVTAVGFLRIQFLIDPPRLKYVHQSGLNRSQLCLGVLVDSIGLRTMLVGHLMCRDSAIRAYFWVTF